MLCVVCGTCEGRIVNFPRTPKSEVRSLLQKLSQLDDWADAYERSIASDDWSWHNQCLTKAKDIRQR